MAFAYDSGNNRITQTGTDTDLSGLAVGTGNITSSQLTITTEGQITQYSIADGVKFHIDGTLTTNPSTELLVINDQLFTTPGPGSAGNPANRKPSSIEINGTWNFGVQTNGVWAEGVGVNFTGGSDRFFNRGSPGDQGAHIQINASGTLNWNGGIMQGECIFGLVSGATINNNARAVFNQQGEAASIPGRSTGTVFPGPYLTRILTANANFNDFNYIGGSLSFGVNTQNSTFAINRFNSDVAYWPQHETSDDDVSNEVSIRDIRVGGNNVDVAVYQNSFMRVLNAEAGSNLICIGGEPDANAANNWGYTYGVREIGGNITNTAGDPAIARVLIRDGGSRGRKNLQSLNDLADNFYIYDFNGSNQFGYSVYSVANGAPFVAAAGNLTQLATRLEDANDVDGIALWVCNVGSAQVASATGRGTNDTGPYQKDLRSKTGIAGMDTFDFHVWSYEHAYTGLLDQNLAGTGAFSVSPVLAADASITENRTQITARNTGLNINTSTPANDALTYTSSSLVVNQAFTLDNLYDLIKFRKGSVDADAEVPNTSSMILSASNGTINMGSLTPTFGSTGRISVGATNTGLTTLGNLNLNNITAANGTWTAGSFLNPLSGGNFNAVGGIFSGTVTLPAISADTEVAINASDLRNVTFAIDGSNTNNAVYLLRVTNDAMLPNTITETSSPFRLSPAFTDVTLNLTLPGTRAITDTDVRLDVFNITGGSLVSTTPLVTDVASFSNTQISNLGRSGGVSDVRVVITGPGLADTITDINIGTPTSNQTISQPITVSQDLTYAAGVTYTGSATDFASSIATTWDAANTRVLYDISGFTGTLARNVDSNALLSAAKGQAAYNVGVANFNMNLVVTFSRSETTLRTGTFLLRNGEATGQQRLQSVRQLNTNGTFSDISSPSGIRARGGFDDVLIESNPSGATDAQIAAAVNESNSAQTTALQTSITDDGASTRSTVWAAKFS